MSHDQLEMHSIRFSFGANALTYRRSIVVLALCGMAAAWLLPLLMLAMHEAHAFSTVREFEIHNMIDVEQVEAYRNAYASADYSIYERVREVGGLRFYFPVLSAILSAIFFAIAVLAWYSIPAGASS